MEAGEVEIIVDQTVHGEVEQHRQLQVSDEKDPRKIARKYQMDLCKKALEENIIVYLGTGTGKTHIAILLIYEMRHLIKKPQKDKCIFLAPTIALVQQQAKVIETSVDFKVGIYCGRSRRHVRDHSVWEKEIEEYEVLVMTPQFLLYCLCHCFIKIDQIALLVFDECHYAQPESNHPYAEIMKVFYKTDLKKLPRIFGMTASPILRKGGSVDNLEALLHAKIYSVKDEGELKQYVASPKVKVYYYDSIKDGYSCPLMSFARKLDDMKIQCISMLQDKIDQNILRIKLLQRLHANIVFCLVNLGLWGALQATHICLKGEVDSIAELDGEESGSDDICKKYLHEASLVLDNGCTRDGGQVDLSCLEVLKEPLFTRKLLKLFELLSNFRGKQNMKCIIFVNRIVTARMLSNLVQNMAFLSFWRCGFLLGVHSGHVSRRSTDIILEKFRSGELNLLVATKVGEEGLDIQTCCLVIRFDLPETVASFIQSRGRARMPQSEYAFLLERDNLAELNLIDDFKRTETLINEEISTRDSPVPTLEFQEKSPYKVDSTGATISSSYSVSLLHHYCSSLPHDEYFNPEPDFFYFDDEDGVLCNVILPVNAPVSKIVSTIQPTKEAAKKDACLRACQKLHEIGALTDYLLPEQDENCEEWISEFSDCGDGNDEESHELHEMLVPAALKNSFTEDVEDHIYFSSYYIKFSPTPVDRTYRRFGLFVKESLPEEAEKMELNLSIDNGRMVMTQLIPCGISPFDKEKIDLAEKFQRMFLKIILDRHEFKAEYLSLEDDILETSPLTYYLLLPVLEDENKYSVDWALVNRCLSSPIFKCPKTASGVETCQLNNPLHLANGCWSIDDIMNSLVYVPCRDIFYFISDILLEKNAHDLHNYKDTRNHAEFYAERFDVHLVYPAQPLLKAKQVFLLANLLRKEKPSGKWREKPEFFVELPPEICELKVLCFSKDIGSSLSLIPSFMHRLESFLVAIELKAKMAESFPEGAKVTTNRILEAITTIRCSEQFSLERLEVLGDAYLKYGVGRYLFLKHDLLDEGQLTKKRSKITSNLNLLNLAKRSNLQVYIRDQTLEPSQFFPFGRPCPVSCNEEAKGRVHSPLNNEKVADIKVRCNKCHHWLHKKTIADFVEALIGAYIVDSGFKAATAFLNWFGIQADILPSQVVNVCRASNAFVPLIDKIDVEVLENNLGYKFTHKGLLIQAFVHPSFKHHSGGCYQRLEFLGDAVLDYMITSYLYSVYPNLDPGHLTDLRSLSVNNMMLADVSVRRSFHKFIVCDSGDLRKAVSKYANLKSLESTERCTEEKTCPKVLGDVLESCVGALFLDTGLDLNHLWKIMLQLLDPVVNKSELQLNPLRNLKELCAFYKWDLQFSTVKKDGKFCVEAKVNGEAASATNKNGKAAGRNAAGQLFERLTTQGYKSSAKSLREVLDESEEMEAMLIGYDEPSHTFTCIVQKLLEASQNDCKTEVYPLSEPSSIISAPPRNGCGNPSNINCIAYGKSAKSRLCELCTAKHWKHPVFECCRQTGQDHSTEFTFKVAMEIEPNVAFEFFGTPLPTKKQAAEAAAKSAIWYFTNEGHMNYCI